MTANPTPPPGGASNSNYDGSHREGDDEGPTDSPSDLSPEEIANHWLLAALLPSARIAKDRLPRDMVTDIGGFPFSSTPIMPMAQDDPSDQLLILDRMAELLELTHSMPETNRYIVNLAIHVGMLCGAQDIAGLRGLERGDRGYNANVAISYRQLRQSGELEQIGPVEVIQRIAEETGLSSRQVRRTLNRMPDYSPRAYTVGDH